MSKPSIIEAMEHPKLFGPWFQGPSWDGWKSILEAAYALEMTAEEVEFFRTVAARDPPKKRVKEVWLCCGRRAGKDSIASLVAAYESYFFEGGKSLRPGERALVACFGNDKEQAKIELDYVRSYYDDLPPLKTRVGRETLTGFELANRCDVSVMVNNDKSIRGRPVLLGILDECSRYRDENSASPDVELYRALRPGLATLPGSMLLGISTPYRKSGVLWNKFKDCYGRDDDDALFIKAPSIALNPTLDQAYIDKELADDPEGARAEWLAEFRSDISAFIDRDMIVRCIPDQSRHELPPMSDVQYFGFCDPSGGSSDSMTLAVCHKDRWTDKPVLDCIRERTAPFSPDDVAAEFAGILKEYRINTIRGDRYAGEWPRDRFSAYGITYLPAELPKSAIYLECLSLFTSGRIELLSNKTLENQLAGLERRTARGGRDSIDHGRGEKDDIANSVCRALLMAAIADRRTGWTLFGVGKDYTSDKSPSRDYIVDDPEAPNPNDPEYYQMVSIRNGERRNGEPLSWREIRERIAKEKEVLKRWA
jgi:hypothetical protein